MTAAIPSPTDPGLLPGRRAARVPADLSSCPRVLVVDDNLVNQKVALLLLERLGYVADAVADARQALALLEQGRHGLVLMDCHMPGMDGYEATAEIRRREAGARHVPIVALTANAFASNRDRCLAVGMDDFLAKPVDARELRRVLSALLPPPAAA